VPRHADMAVLALLTLHLSSRSVLIISGLFWLPAAFGGTPGQPLMPIMVILAASILWQIAAVYVQITSGSPHARRPAPERAATQSLPD
jgi:hypothetical protein